MSFQGSGEQHMRHFWGGFTLPVSCWSCWAAPSLFPQVKSKENPSPQDQEIMCHHLKRFFHSLFSIRKLKRISRTPKIRQYLCPSCPGTATGSLWGMLTKLSRRSLSLSPDPLKWWDHQDKKPGESWDDPHRQPGLHQSVHRFVLYFLTQHLVFFFSEYSTFFFLKFQFKAAAKRLSGAKDMM